MNFPKLVRWAWVAALPYVVTVSTANDGKLWYHVSGNGEYSVALPNLQRESAEDLAEALNQAHENRVKKARADDPCYDLTLGQCSDLLKDERWLNSFAVKKP